MSNNKVDKAIKRKKSMLISSIGWGVMAAALGFLLTLILSCIAAYKTSYVDALSYLATSYFNLILEIANRNPGFAHFILHSQTLAEAQIFQGLNDGQAFILGHFSKLQNISAPSGKISNLIDDATYHLYGFLYLAKWSLKLDIIKFISVFCSLMVFIFAGFLGLLDGLLTRYIRTAEGGRFRHREELSGAGGIHRRGVTRRCSSLFHASRSSGGERRSGPDSIKGSGPSCHSG